MFRALHAHHQEDELYWCSISQSVAVWCTGWPLTESDYTRYTRCCINKIHPPDDEHKNFETCRGL